MFRMSLEYLENTVLLPISSVRYMKSTASRLEDVCISRLTDHALSLNASDRGLVVVRGFEHTM